MAHHVATVDCTTPAEDAFAYLADFTNAEEWDPSTASAVRVEEGTYRLVVRFLGRSVPLTYRAVEVDAPDRIVFDVEGDRVRGRDAITVEALTIGCRVHYDARVRITGVLGVVAEPLLAFAFGRAARAAAAGIRSRLDR